MGNAKSFRCYSILAVLPSSPEAFGRRQAGRTIYRSVVGSASVGVNNIGYFTPHQPAQGHLRTNHTVTATTYQGQTRQQKHKQKAGAYDTIK